MSGDLTLIYSSPGLLPNSKPSNLLRLPLLSHGPLQPASAPEPAVKPRRHTGERHVAYWTVFDLHLLP